MGYQISDDGPPCAFAEHGADPKLTYLAIRPDHTAYATVHFLGYWLTATSSYNPETGQCGPVTTTFIDQPWDMGVTWSPTFPDASEFETVCFSPPWDCSGPASFILPPWVPVVFKRDVRRWGS
jgi:hypothetical protein